MDYLIYPLCGAVAGLIAGLFGVGGGLVIVPVLATVFSWQALAPDYTMQMALGTSLATIVATSLSSMRAHHQRGGVNWIVFGRLLPAIALGTWFGAALADYLRSEQLRVGFGLVEMGLGLYLWRKKAVSASATGALPSRGISAVAGLGIGSASSLAGIGGGTLTVPFLVRSGLSMASAVGTSAACGFPIALFGSLSYAWWGWGQPGLPAGATGYLYWPAALGIVVASVLFAPLGAKWAHRLPETRLKQAFAILLFLMGFKMLLF